jgi:soluble lytic murein transglycosylase-like protein
MLREASALVAVAAVAAAASPCLAQSGAHAKELAEAVAYEHGEGVPKDPARAAQLYCGAARELNADALFRLGWMYANGRGVPRDDSAAASLFASAAALGHPQANNLLALLASVPRRAPECMRQAVLSPLPVPDFQLDELESHAGVDPFIALPPWKQQIASVVDKLAPKFSISRRLALAIIAVESNFASDARSHKGAAGLMQLMPETADRFNVASVYDVSDNVRGGLAYLRWLLAYYQGDVRLAVAAYNAGEKAVDKYGGIPPYPETQSYVRRVLSLYGSETHPYTPVVRPSPAARRP